MVGEVGEPWPPEDVVVGEEGWKVGLWDGACNGFLGKREIGGECNTSD